MGLRKFGALALGLTFGLVATSPATAAPSNVAIERSGNTFHKAACSHNQRLGRARCFAHVVTDSAGRIRTFQPTGRPNFNFTGYTPADLQSAYKLPSNGGSGSYTVAIVDAYGYPNAEADLAVYRAKYGLPPCTTANGCFKKVNQSGVEGNYPATDVGWDQEQALDLSISIGEVLDATAIAVPDLTSVYRNLGRFPQHCAREGYPKSAVAQAVERAG